MSEETFTARDGTWDAVGDYLREDSLLLLSADDAARFRERHREIRDDEANVDDVLLIGIVGGTGVGKSTFINALAGREVSRSSDRRPTTARVIVYRHVDVELDAEIPPQHLSQPQVLHEHENLQHVVVFDFPDFDSAEVEHRDILHTYLPFLDVLLVVVEDVKYGDRRLYDLLRGMDHDSRNLFVLFNKIDRLENRYADDTGRVIGELISDFQSKLREHADLSLDLKQFLPISARRAFEARQGSIEATPEDFQQVESLLGEFRQEKRRREAKTLNLESRKEVLVGELRSAALSSTHLEALAAVEKMSRSWRDDLSRTADGLTGSLFGRKQRRLERGRRLRESRSAWGFPFSLIFTLLGEWRRFRVEAGESSRLTPGRLAQGFRPYFDALENMSARLRDELDASGIGSEDVLDDPIRDWSHAAAAKVEAEISAWRPPGRRQRWLAQIPALGTMALFAWSCAYPAFKGLLDGDDTTGFWGPLGTAILGALSPTFIVGAIVTTLAVYVVSAGFLWLRTIQKVDESMERADSLARRSATDAGLRALDKLLSRVKALESERDRLSSSLDR